MRHRDLTETLDELSASAWAYAALAAALESGLLERLGRPLRRAEAGSSTGLDQRLADDIVEALLALGVVGERDGTLQPTPALEALGSSRAARVLRSGIRGDHLQIAELLARLRDGGQPAGWAHDDPLALSAQGETGALTGELVEALLPRLEGLGERMSQPGARILDVGAGVGVVAAELCRVWPAAEAVGLEPHRPARELGRQRIAAAGLSGRIALRDERVERLGEIAAYDLAFLPQPFLGRECLEAGLPRVQRALRSGGWLIVLTQDLAAPDPLTAAARRFRARIWGGGAIELAELEAILGECGFTAIRSDYPVGSYRAVCARRAGERAGILPRHDERQPGDHPGVLSPPL